VVARERVCSYNRQCWLVGDKCAVQFTNLCVVITAATVMLLKDFGHYAFCVGLGLAFVCSPFYDAFSVTKTIR
jgi:hypothetical protein